MTRPARIIRNIAIGFAALLIVIVVAAIMVVQTDWFRQYVRQKIISATEESTGGKVDLASFAFDWRHLQAVVTGFVIHGAEPPGTAPFLSARRVQLDIRLFTSMHHLLDLAYLGIEQPQANVIVFPDGHTNIPNPKEKSSSNKTPLETVVDLAVDHFDLSNGLVTVSSQRQPLDIRGNNLQVQLWYNVLNQGYRGQLSFQPLYVAAGKNMPVNFTVTLPVKLQRDRVDFQNARISTALSSLTINGFVESMRDPKISAHIQGNVALADLKNAANLPSLDLKYASSELNLDGKALIASNRIDVQAFHLGLGHSDLEASGTLKDPLGNGSLRFKSRLFLAELGRLAKLAARPDGTVLLNGQAKLDAANNYLVTGNLQVERVSFQQSARRINNINLYSEIRFDPHDLDLEGLRLAAFGGELVGKASLRDFRHYRLDANLRHLDLAAAARTLGDKQFPYSAVVSGPIEGAGDLKEPGPKSITATARLAISPGPRGIPVSGRVNAAYNGSADDLRLDNSYIALPHTRLAFNGSAGRRMNVSLTTTDLHDLLSATSMASNPPVTLNGGQAAFTGLVAGLSSPRITGHLAASRFSVEGRQFDRLDLDAVVSAAGAAVRNGSLTRGAMQAHFSASVGLRKWKALPNEPITADATVNNGDLADMVALAGRPAADYSGLLVASVRISGTVGNPRGAANLQVSSGAIYGEPFDRLQAQVNLSDQLVTVSSASLEAGAARVSLTAEFQHPRDSFFTGHLHAHLESNQVNLAQVRNLQKQQPDTAGAVQLNIDVAGNLSQSSPGGTQKPEFLLTSVNGDASARGLRFQSENYGDITATARTSGSTVSYNATSDFAGSAIRINGRTQLAGGYPTTADVTVRNLPLQPVFKAAQRPDIPATGTVSGSAHFSGTVHNPQGSADVDLAGAVIYSQPVDHVRARLTYLSRSIDLQQLEVVSGPSRIELSANYQHPPGNLQEGSIEFRVNSNRLDLGKIKLVQDQRPGLGGVLQIVSDGAAEVHPKEPRLTLGRLNAEVKANGIAAQGKNFGDAEVTANTAAGRLNFTLTSDLAGAAIHGSGNAQLAGDYPIDARLSFQNVTWTRLDELLGAGSAEAPRFEAAADGEVTVRGPVRNTDQLNGSLRLTRLQVNNVPAPGANGSRPVVLQNRGPIAATLDRGVVRIESAHIAGPQTDIQATGAVPLRGQGMSLTVNGNMDLAILQNFGRDITSSGNIVLATTVRGTVTEPLVNGTLELKNASFNYASLPNGIANANGTVVFNGSSASIRNLTAESGGGKLTLAGYAVRTDTLRFGLRVNGSNVRVRLQQGVSIFVDANVNLSGAPDSSALSGAVTIDRVSYAPRTDLGSVLSAAAPPVQAPSAPSPLLDNMRLDIRVRTSDATAVQASLAENLQADADLRIRGTASHPGVLGRVTITEGKLVFFGSTYTVNTGTIGFYNPVRIDPVLDLSLETSAKGVDVVLRVTGPVDNMKLSYTSDPPLQFQEIVSLLAAGTVPTSDPTLLANQPSQPPQSFQQMGESALLSKAVAAPVAGQLQRVFGVSQLHIDPTIAGGSELPTARLTLQQRIATNLTFTYITDVTAANTQIIRIEWTVNPRWSAVATRDENGIFSLDFLYKKELR